MKSLPTKEEYFKGFDPNTPAEDLKMEWNKALFKCPICNGEVKRDYSVVYMSNPPKYRYWCRNCAWEQII